MFELHRTTFVMTAVAIGASALALGCSSAGDGFEEVTADAEVIDEDATGEDSSAPPLDTGTPDTRVADTRVADTQVATDTRPASETGATDGCAGKANGSFCGANLSPAGNSGTLYQCLSGKISTSQVCSAGCDATKNACYPTGGGAITESSGAATASPPTAACNFFAPSTCGDCADTACCTEESACFGVADCTALWNCLSACPSGGTACRQACADKYPSQIARVNAINSCVNTKCATACGADPCAKFPFAGYGNACGANLDPSASQHTLYWCQDKKLVTSVYCANGCYAAPDGQPDYCIGSDPCVSSPFAGVNKICGRSLSGVVNQNSLYTCDGRKTVSVVTCSAGCYQAPPNEADRCN